MGYRKFTPELFEEISHIIDEIERLRPGEAWVSHRIADDKDFGSLRLKLYEWLHGTGLKRLYRISCLPSAGVIRVTRLGDLSKVGGEVTGVGVGVIGEVKLDELMKELIEVGPESVQDDAGYERGLEKIEGMLGDGVVNQEEAEELRFRWKRVMG